MNNDVRRWSWGGVAALVLPALGHVTWHAAVALAAVLIPVADAVLLAALLWPAVAWLRRHRLPRALAAALVLVTSLAPLGTLPAFPVDTLVSGAGGLGAALRDAALDDLVHLVAGQSERILGGATATAAAVGTAPAGVVLSLFALYFFLHNSDRLWRGVLRAAPAHLRDRADGIGRRVFHALSGLTGATPAVAVVDAVAIGIGLAAVGVALFLLGLAGGASPCSTCCDRYRSRSPPVPRSHCSAHNNRWRATVRPFSPTCSAPDSRSCASRPTWACAPLSCSSRVSWRQRSSCRKWCGT